MKYMLDTNVLMHVVNFNTGYRRIIKHIQHTEKADMVFSAITYFELISKIIAAKIGREKAERREQKTLECWGLTQLCVGATCRTV
jgi:predicted nucleic acid-binding protein